MEYKDVRIVFSSDTALVYVPLHPDFIKEIKSSAVGARWDPKDRCWRVPLNAVTKVRAVTEEVFGHSDISKDSLLSLRVKTTKDVCASDSTMFLYGKRIIAASWRDNGVNIGEDVQFTKGGGEVICDESGELRKNHRVYIKADSVFTINNVSKNLYTRTSLPDGMKAEVVSEETINRKALKKEKKRLKKRIKEINELLK